MAEIRPAPVPEELAASVRHLELIDQSLAVLHDKTRRVKEARRETLVQIATAAKRYVDGQPQGTESAFLFDLYESLKTDGLFTAWKAAGLPHPARLRADVGNAIRHAPNESMSGGWVGRWDWDVPGGPLCSTYPRDGTPVVYVLYGANAEPVYCGSTEHFRSRLNSHDRDGKVFVAWRAVPCRSREDAFVLEDRLLRQSCPPLNRRAGR